MFLDSEKVFCIFLLAALKAEAGKDQVGNQRPFKA
jgi:hypothetical protein